MEIKLIGALHNDPNGYDSTMAALGELQPSVLAVEWPGEAWENFKLSQEFIELRDEMDRAIRSIFNEFGLDESLYDQGSRIMAERWGNEVRAVREYGTARNIVVVPTESSEVRIATDLSHFRNIEGACDYYRQWLTRLTRPDGEGYDPEAVNTFEPWGYQFFEAYLKGEISQDEIEEFFRNHQSVGIFKPERVDYQVDQITRASGDLSDDQVLVHVGGLAHLVDDDPDRKKLPRNLWQHLVQRFGDNVSRYSLRNFG